MLVRRLRTSAGRKARPGAGRAPSAPGRPPTGRQRSPRATGGREPAPRNFRKPHQLPPRSRRALTVLPSPRTTADETLARAAASGSRAAFELLVDRYGGRVQALLERRLGDHDAALDLTQETWVRVFRALPRFDAERSFRAWLFAIALNAARDEQRRRRRTPLEFVDAPVAAVAADSERSDHTQAVERALLGVAEPYRSALLLVDVEGLDYAEAATSAGCAVGTMKSRVARGREAFRQTWRRVTGETGRRSDE